MDCVFPDTGPGLRAVLHFSKASESNSSVEEGSIDAIEAADASIALKSSEHMRAHTSMK